jgi:hypothetical protein
VTEYNCRVPGCEFTSHARRDIPSQARKHKRQYRDLEGERHDNYDDVKELLAGRVGGNGDLLSCTDRECDASGDQLTLTDAVENGTNR